MDKLFYNNVTGQVVLEHCKSSDDLDEFEVSATNGDVVKIDKDNNKLNIVGVDDGKITTEGNNEYNTIFIKNNSSFTVSTHESANEVTINCGDTNENGDSGIVFQVKIQSGVLHRKNA